MSAVLLLLYFFLIHRSTIEESLSPNWEVARISAQGLVLANGRTLALPGFPVLPVDPRGSALLRILVERGVELDANGRVIGLVKIWHWCGNDPIGKHIARVDIAHVLLFFGYGDVPPSLASYRSRRSHADIGEYGWNISDWGDFRHFSMLLTYPELSVVQLFNMTRFASLSTSRSSCLNCTASAT